NAVPTSGARSLPDIAARCALGSGDRRTPDTASEPAPESLHPHTPGRADSDAFHNGRPACGLGISDDSCAGLAKMEPPDAGPRRARPPTPLPTRYAEITLRTKQAAVAACLPPVDVSAGCRPAGGWRKDEDL